MSRSRLSKICVALGVSALLPSCSWLDAYAQPEPEVPVAGHETYLQGGPSTEVELGAGERTLLEDYKILNDTKMQLQSKLDEMTAENEQLRKQLGMTEQERDQFRNHHAGSEKEGERLHKRSQQLEAKVLSLTIENTMLEQELLRHRIASLRQQYEDIVAVSATPSSTPILGGER